MKKRGLFSLMVLGTLFINGLSLAKEQDPLYNRDGLFISHVKATYRGRVLYNAAMDLKSLFKREGKRLEGVEFYYTPLSLVGPYLSYEQDYFDDGGSGASARVPNNTRTVRTVDIRSNRPVSLLELVEEKSLVEAMKKDQWVRERVEDAGQLESCQSFKEVLQLGGLGDDLGNRFKVDSFAFFAFDHKTGGAALRLIRQDYMGYNHNQLLQLGLWVKPQEKMKKLFSLQSNFFMPKFAADIGE